jgi:hypothetical protein
VEAGGGMTIQARRLASFLFVTDAQVFETEKLALLLVDA